MSLSTQNGREPGNALASVGIEDRSVNVPPQAGDLADAFAKELRNTRVASDVYYPQRPKDPIDTTLEKPTSFVLAQSRIAVHKAPD